MAAAISYVTDQEGSTLLSDSAPWPASGLVRQRLRATALWTALELAIVVGWAVAFGRAYLNPDPAVVSLGREFTTAIQPYHFWPRLLECGACALWNGSVRGGVPALVDVHASLLHPLPALSVLLAGVPNGMKLAVVGALALGGLAQWWLGQVLGLGRLARTWAGMMAVVAGNLAGRMEGGWVNLVIAGAACALVFAPLVALARGGGRRWAVVLGLVLGQALVAGQGYLQIGLAAVLPLAFLLVPEGGGRRFARELALAGALALLVAAPFLVPLGHFLPEFGKDKDPSFRTAQPVQFVPLNFVIDDKDFYYGNALRKEPFPGLYVNFVGWLPVLFALLAVVAAAHRERRAGDRRLVAFFAASVALLVWLASAMPFRLLMTLSPYHWLDDQLAGVRNAALIAGLAVTPLLGLAAMGVDRLLAADWPDARLAVGPAGRGRHLPLDERWLLGISLAAALIQAEHFNARWLDTQRLPDDVARHLDELATPDLQWISPPFGEHAYVEAAVARGMKVVHDLKPWFWWHHDEPEPYRIASRTGEDDPALRELNSLGDVRIYQGPADRAYASVQGRGRLALCQARGTGGDIDVYCDRAPAGLLTVREHATRDWYAEVLDRPVALKPGLWLSLDLPAGAERVRLRYRPWDVPLGLALGLAGLLLAGWLLWRTRLA
jgi:hypothetical protein